MSRRLSPHLRIIVTLAAAALAYGHAAAQQPAAGDTSRPVVLVRGGDSPVVPLPAVADLRRARPDIEIVTVPGAGHMVPWDQLDGFLDSVRPHLLAHLTQH